jgi:acyl carrier protein
MTSLTEVDRRIPALVRSELVAVTGEPIGVFSDDALLSELGIESLALIEALLSVREQILEELGIAVDDADDPPTLPWMETVGELIAFVRSSLPTQLET